MTKLVLLVGGVLVFLIIWSLYKNRPKKRIGLPIASQKENDDQTQLLTLINSMAEAFLAIDHQQKILLHNPAASKILHSNEIDGQELRVVLPVVNKLKETVDLNRLIESNRSIVIERNDLILIHDDQSSVTLDLSISPVSLDSKTPGSTSGVSHIIVVRDVTERKNLEEQREEFLSIISHELRTPIATAEADLSVLLNPKMSQLNERSLHYATVAHEQVVFLSQLLNDITSLSRLEKDSFRTKPEPFNAAQFTEKLRDEFAATFADKNLLFRCVIGENLPVVITNPNEVKEIMTNLLINASKYTREGTVTLSVEGSYKAKTGVLFTVQDTGLGIAKTDLQHVFEKFFRSEDYRTRESGGAGLGLYLCARLAERMKASLWVESELKRGSRFNLFIPQQSAKPPDVKEFLTS